MKHPIASFDNEISVLTRIREALDFHGGEENIPFSTQVSGLRLNKNQTALCDPGNNRVFKITVEEVLR